MEAQSIDGKTLLSSAAAVLSIEIFLAAASMRLPGRGLWLLAVARIIEILLLIAIVCIRRKNLACLGLRKDRILTGLYRGMLWSFGFAVMTLLLALGLMFFHIDPVRMLQMRPQAESPALFYALGSLVGPVAEELFFRGIIYGYLRSWGFGCALLGSTAAFAGAHSFSAFPVVQIVGGLVFAAAYEAEKNLMVPIVIHALGNSALFAIASAGTVCMP